MLFCLSLLPLAHPAWLDQSAADPVGAALRIIRTPKPLRHVKAQHRQCVVTSFFTSLSFPKYLTLSCVFTPLRHDPDLLIHFFRLVNQG